MRGGKGSVARFGPGFFSKPNTVADTVQEFVFSKSV